MKLMSDGRFPRDLDARSLPGRPPDVPLVTTGVAFVPSREGEIHVAAHSWVSAGSTRSTRRRPVTLYHWLQTTAEKGEFYKRPNLQTADGRILASGHAPHRFLWLSLHWSYPISWVFKCNYGFQLLVRPCNVSNTFKSRGCIFKYEALELFNKFGHPVVQTAG